MNGRKTLYHALRPVDIAVEHALANVRLARLDMMTAAIEDDLESATEGGQAFALALLELVEESAKLAILIGDAVKARAEAAEAAQQPETAHG